MSYSDFERGIKTVPFCQRKTESDAKDNHLINEFFESERRLSMLRSFTAEDRPPTLEEMKKWIDKQKKR
jgi:hypothetical protein